MQGKINTSAMPFVPLIWALYAAWLLFHFVDWWARKRKRYQQILSASQGDSWQRRMKRDSRGLVRAIHLMDKGASLFQVDRSYWDKLSRRLSMMGEKMGAKEMVTLTLLRSMMAALPSLALPLIWENGWMALYYPVGAAMIFRFEMKDLDRKYTRWQKELVRDIPEVMDRLRICFAGGRDYLSALRQAQVSAGPAMAGALSQLIEDIQTIGSVGAFRLFSISFDMPAIQKLTSALMLAVESGYMAAEAYFNSIEGELSALRQEAAESLVRTKPEKIYQLYTLLFLLAVAALLLKGWEILGQVGTLFGA